MDTATATRSIDPSLPPKAVLLTGKTSSGQHGRLFWQVFRAAFDFGFFVDHDGKRVHTGKADHDTAPAAEKAAAQFCRDWIEAPEPAAEAFFDAAVAPAVVEAPTPAAADDEPLSVTVAGWDVLATAGRPGTFKAELSSAATGQRGAADKDFTGFSTPAEALKAGVSWATEHPCDPRLAALDEPRISTKVDGQVIDLEEIYGDADEPISVAGWHVVSTDEKGGTYGAELHDPVTGVIVTDGGTAGFKGYETAGAAIQAATEYAHEHPTASCAAREAELEADEVKTDACVAGWAISIEQSASGRFEAILVDVQDGNPYQGPEDFSGYESREEALEEASRWAAENHTDAEDKRRMAAEDAAAARRQPVADQLLALGDSAEVATLRAMLAQRDAVLAQRDADVALAIEQRDAALAGIAADMRKGGDDATEYRKLALQKNQNNYAIAQLKDSNKGIDVRMGELGLGLVDLVEGMATGTLGKAYQQTLTFDASSAVRASVGAQAAQVVAAIGSQKWAFLGTEHVIESNNQDTPQGLLFTTWIRGHRETTEGFGETYEQAAEQTRAAASVVFADCDPGEAPASADPAVRLPTKKAKLKGHDIDAVTSALEQSLSLLDAAEALKVNVPKLEAFLKKHGIVTSKHLAKRAGEETPAPKAKRGRKPKAVSA